VQITCISYQKADFPEIAWLKRLLPGCSLEFVEDLTQTQVIPNSIVICKRLGKLRKELLQSIAVTPGVVLFHISDEWYLDRLAPYRNFVHVLRNYHHSALQQEGITQIPMGPSRAKSAEAISTAERRYLWCFAGNLASTRRSMVQHLKGMEPSFLHVTGTRDQSASWLKPEEYLKILSQSSFVPCPMGNVNLESFRLYEALDSGAIPILERRPWLDYFTQLFGAHPLPSVCNWREARSVMETFRSHPERLKSKQAEIQNWWQQWEAKISHQVTEVIRASRGQKKRMNFTGAVPSRLRGACEMLRHHNATALIARTKITFKRLSRGRAAR
jgi:hypothetical protein